MKIIQLTIEHKMADQGQFDLDVVFTMILCGYNFYLTRYEAHIHKLASKSFSEYVDLISKLDDLKLQTY